MWTRKNSLERRLDTLESGTATAVEELAATIGQRFDNEAGRQLANNLAQLSKSVEQLDLSDSMLKRRKELERAARKASRQMKRAVKDLEKTRGRVARDANALAAKVSSDANALATRVGESVEHGGQQLVTLGQKTAPAEPTAWLMPSLFGFLLGFGAGFLFARNRKDQAHHA